MTAERVKSDVRPIPCAADEAHGVRRILLPVTAVAASILLLGCGSSHTVAKAEVVKRGNAVCLEAQRRYSDVESAVAEVNPAADPNATKRDFLRYARNVELVAPAFRYELAGIEALGHPDSDAETLRQMQANLREVYLASLQQDRAARDYDQRALIAALGRFEIASGRWLALADRFGLTGCL